ncbi:MAG: hypothetical protein K2X31_06790, partial [Sphingopyxis sp.]|nr:hypothetical protein [Sphingopyxis sp.]
MARCGFDGAIDAIYQAAAEPALWPAALEQIADHVGGLGAILVHNDIAHRKGFIVSGRLRDDLGELYLREYCDNPLVAAIAKYGRPGRPDLVSTFAGNIAVKRTAFHADILEPQAIVDQIAMPHQALTGNGNSGGFSVMLSSRHVDDASAAVNRMMRLAPHLSRALDLSLDVAEHRNVAGRLATLL